MGRSRRRRAPDIPADPFREREQPLLHEQIQLLGGRFQFSTDSAQLLGIVRHAYAGLPPHRLGAASPRLLVKLLLLPAPRRLRAPRTDGEPPQVRPLAGRGLLCGAMDSASFMAATPRERSAVVVVSRDSLRFPYHVRYELLEFAVYVLAARVQGLVPLHAACVGAAGDGVLLVGSTGAGKSTLALLALLGGLDFLSEDSVLIDPMSLRATGVANFLHVRPETLRFVEARTRAAVARRAAIIRRRSGVRKLEIDVRQTPYRMAPAPLHIRALVELSPQTAGRGPLLSCVPAARLLRRLAHDQPYAVNQPGWRSFAKRARHLPAFELRRGHDPAEAVAAVKALLAGAGAHGPLAPDTE